MENRLYRSTTDKMLGGVCAGLGNYFHIDVTVVRLFFVILTLFGGAGPLIYVILWIVVPPEGHMSPSGQPERMDGTEFKERAGMMRDDFVDAVKAPNKNTTRFVGIGLVLLGGFLVLKQLDISWLKWLNGDVIWAVLILVVGAVLLVQGIKGEK